MDGGWRDDTEGLDHNSYTFSAEQLHVLFILCMCNFIRRGMIYMDCKIGTGAAEKTSGSFI